MKHLILLLLIGGIPGHIPTSAQPLKVGDKVYSHAPNGLTLRKTPAKDGLKVALIPYNAAPLLVLTLPDPTTRFAAESIGTFAIEGGWMNVRTRDGQEGYLFSGYLSTHPPAIEEPEEGIEPTEWFYQTLSPLAGKHKKLPPINGSNTHYQQDYADGAQFELQVFEGGATQILTIPAGKFSMQEAFVLFRPVWFGTSQTTGHYVAQKKFLTINSDGGMTQLTMQQTGNRLIMTFRVAD
ncbi:hypothetical protein [Fibrella aquatilis]|uniref:SH3 domain-containing protein n=1 Tax=Fibrella aquatilis TaxID=2817059 RepID=A0A939G8I5_9BACT|nr:hypothetical protein [Fibrella aquatilis]MBO0934392.1 hypothetical protein [Fibrella aquatilis]